MANQQTVTVNVLADTKRFSSAMRSAGDNTDLLTKSIKGFGIAAAAAFTAAAVSTIAYAAKSIKSASELEQSIGGVEAVFKEYAGTVEETSKKAAQSLGLSRDAYNKVATIIGTQLKASGTTLDQLAGKTNDLVTVAADLAATFGGDVTEATTAVTSALRGEFEPLRRFGIALSVAQIETEALAMTQKTAASQLTATEKAAAAQSLIFKGAADATGQFGREADTLAGKQQRLKADLENIQATIGEALLPVVVEATDQFAAFIGELIEKPEFKRFLDDVTTSLQTLLPQVITAITNFGTFAYNILPDFRDILGVVNSTLKVLNNTLGDTSTKGSNAWKWISDLRYIMDNLAKVTEGVDKQIKSFNNGLNSLGTFGTIAKAAIDAFAGSLVPIQRGLEAIANLIKFINGTPVSTNVTNPATGRPYTSGGLKLAEGGIVMPRPGGVQATIAEAGEAEAVIPLSKMGSMGTTVVINGNVGYDAVELAREIARRQAQVNALTGVNRLIGVS